MKIRPSHIAKPVTTDHLHHLAFDNSFLPNIISIAGDGRIIAANLAAGKLLGYSKKILLTKNMKDIFSVSGSGYKLMLKQRESAGHAMGNLTVIKKDGKHLPCQVTSVVFTGENNIKKAITTLLDRSLSIRRQKYIDHLKDEKLAAEIIFSQFRSDTTLNRLGDLEHSLDNQQTVFEKEMKDEIKLKGIQIADAVTEAKEMERSDLGKELHDHVNQLLVASRLYLDIARMDNAHREMYLSRSSEYTMSAIEEIRKLTKGLIYDVLENLGLSDAIHNITVDLMEVYPVKISCSMDNEIQTRVSAKFNLNVFRIVQEQLNNIIKHAKASVVKIGFSQNKSAIILSISDNGSGFNLTKKREGIGIANIKNRAEHYKGTAHFASEPGKGCVLTVTFPVGDSQFMG